MNIRTMLHRLAATALTAVLGTVAGGLPAHPAAAATGAGSPATVAHDTGSPDRYLVRYTRGTDIAAMARDLRAQDIAVRRTFGHAVKAALVTLTPAQAAALVRSPRVASVEVDGPVHATGTQSGAPWGLDRLDQRTLPLSTTFTAPAAGAGVTAYVVDTGVLATHADLSGRVAPGWTAIADGSGSSDCNGHGTHVAGTIAGTTYGVAKAATVVPVRVLDCSGSGYMSDVVAGLDWVAANHAAGAPAVVNLSLGGDPSATVDAALDGVIADGVTAAVAAGNSSADACTSSPARVTNALTVAASDSGDRQASFSNYGSCVDVYAPGVAITSAWYTSNTATAVLSGTSMAAPHVAGVAAVLLSQDPTLSPGQVAARVDGDATAGVVAGATSGTPNRLLYLAPGADAPTTSPTPAPTAPVATVPDPATSLKATAGRRSAKLTWLRGADGGSPLTSQQIRVYRGSTQVSTVAVSATATAANISGLKPGASYSFTVVETNVVGSSAASARSNQVVPLR